MRLSSFVVASEIARRAPDRESALEEFNARLVSEGLYYCALALELLLALPSRFGTGVVTVRGEVVPAAPGEPLRSGFGFPPLDVVAVEEFGEEPAEVAEIAPLRRRGRGFVEIVGVEVGVEPRLEEGIPYPFEPVEVVEELGEEEPVVPVGVEFISFVEGIGEEGLVSEEGEPYPFELPDIPEDFEEFVPLVPLVYDEVPREPRLGVDYFTTPIRAAALTEDAWLPWSVLEAFEGSGAEGFGPFEAPVEEFGEEGLE